MTLPPFNMLNLLFENFTLAQNRQSQKLKFHFPYL